MNPLEERAWKLIRECETLLDEKEDQMSTSQRVYLEKMLLVLEELQRMFYWFDKTKKE